MKPYPKTLVWIIGLIAALLMTITSTQAIAVTSRLNVKVNCAPAEAGTYSLGWGTSRLIVPEDGSPYTTFRGNTAPEEDGRLCQSGDNVGAVFFRNDGTVWAYVKAND